MHKKLLISLLVVVPLIFLFTGFKFDRTKYSTDPECAYLLNGLNIATFHAVGHYDNPGTTVQIYSAMVLRVTHFLRFSGTDIETDVLSNSEYYIEVLRYSLIVLNAFVLLLLGMVSFWLLGNIWLSFIMQVAPFLSVTLIEECFTKVAPEPVLFATVSILALILLKLYVSQGKTKKKYILVFALLSGFGLATKMTFLPLVLIPFFVLQGWPAKIKYIVLIIPSFVLFTLPAAKVYPHMAYWFLNLSTHTGTYGQGGTGIIDPVQYLNALLQIVKVNPELCFEIVTASFALIFISFGKKYFFDFGSRKSNFILFSVVLAQVASILLVAKHYHSNHYLFPALSLLGLAIILIIVEIGKHFKIDEKKFMKIVPPLVLVAMIGVAFLHKPTLTLAYQGYRMSNQDTDETQAMIEREYKDYVKTYYYPASFNEYPSLRWGSVYSQLIHTDRLMKIFPQGLFYNAWEKSFQLWETNISPAEFLARYGDKILIIGGPRTYDELKKLRDAGLKLKKISEGRIQVVYEVDVAHSAMFSKDVYSGTPEWGLKNDFEKFSPDKKWILLDGEQFCPNSALSDDKPRSGKFSFSLPGKDDYAMAYELSHVKPGDRYRISIWRYADNEGASLVISSQKGDLFYQISKGYSEVDKKGWKKLNVLVKIPGNYSEDKIKVYLWNQGGEHAWFDDFEIIKFK